MHFMQIKSIFGYINTELLFVTLCAALLTFSPIIFFSQQIQIHKNHHLKARKIVIEHNYFVNLSKFLLGLTVVRQVTYHFCVPGPSKYRFFCQFWPIYR